LPLLPERQKGPTFNHFLDAARLGYTDPPAIWRHAILAMKARLFDDAEHHELRDALTIVMAEREEALKLAEEAIAHVRMTPEERAARDEQRQGYYRDQWRKTQPPTDKQLDFLAKLHYEGPPIENSLQASQAIDALLQQQKGGKRGAA
jgi:hypothetical protein